MANINEFIANFGKAARPNRYRVELVYPAISGGDGKDIKFYAKGASIPPSTLGVINIPYMGRVFKQAGDRTFPEWTLTVMNDTSFSHRNAMEKWSNAINSHVGNGQLVDNYFARAMFYQLDNDEADTVIKQYIIENLWPSDVGAIEVGYETTDTVEEFTVTFQYSHWTAVTTS